MARILLVDDEKMARTLYGDYLREAGHSVTAVSSFEEVQEALAVEPYDAVVTDLILPGTDGMEVLRYTKERYPGIEVVVITGLDKVDPAVRAIKSGAAEYLVKPVAPEALQHAVRRALTTRDLLRENASLRQYVSLLEMGQRIATTLDRERLAIAVSSALEAQTLASAALLLSRETGPLKLHGHSGLEPEIVAELEPVLCEQLQGIRTPRALENVQVGYPHVLAFPASDGDLSLGQIVLFFSGADRRALSPWCRSAPAKTPPHGPAGRTRRYARLPARRMPPRAGRRTRIAASRYWPSSFLRTPNLHRIQGPMQQVGPCSACRSTSHLT